MKNDGSHQSHGKAQQAPAATQVEVIPAPKVEVLPPEPALPAPQLRMPSPKLDAELDRSEHQIRSMFSTLDFDVPEGFLDRCLYRPTHRLTKKVAHAELIAQFQGAMVKYAHEKCNLADEVRRYEQLRQQQFLDALITWRTACEEYYRVQHVASTMARAQVVETAKAEAEIEKFRADTADSRAKIAECEKRMRDARREHLPPPTPDQVRAEKKTRIQSEIDRLNDEESDEIDRLTDVKPEAEWSPEVRDEVKRVQNMYANARDRKQRELRRYL